MHIHRHLHRLRNSNVSDPAIMNILAFNFKETKKSAEIDLVITGIDHQNDYCDYPTVLFSRNFTRVNPLVTTKKILHLLFFGTKYFKTLFLRLQMSRVSKCVETGAKAELY